MRTDREPHLRNLTGKKLLIHSSLAGLLAIATSTGNQCWANPNSNRDLPKVDAGVTTSGSTESKPLPAPATTGATTSSNISHPVATTQSSTSTSSATSPISAKSSNIASSPRFFCQVWNGRYTVMYSPENHSGETFPWAVPQALGGGWQPEKRCAEISRRLEEYRPDGLQELRTAKENGYNTVCATTQSKAACRLVFTVPPGQDPVATRNSVFRNLTVADSGQTTQGVNTFVSTGNGNLNLNDNLVNMGLSIVGGNSTWRNSFADTGIDLTPYLDPSDGGSGLGMTNGVQVTKTLRLNPERFR
jgi:hypothetical protein